MTPEQMIDELIRIYAFDNTPTVWFCELAEDKNLTDSALENAMICAITMPMVEMEEGE